jgi:hypothetical protein
VAESFTSSVQYDDLTGTIAFDGNDGGPLFKLAELIEDMPAGYFPVGFRLVQFHPNGDGTIPFDIFAARMSDSGDTVDEIVKNARERNGLDVHTFSGRVPVEMLPSLFKRIDLKAFIKELPRTRSQIHAP